MDPGTSSRCSSFPVHSFMCWQEMNQAVCVSTWVSTHAFGDFSIEKKPLSFALFCYRGKSQLYSLTQVLSLWAGKPKTAQIPLFTLFLSGMTSNFKMWLGKVTLGKSWKHELRRMAYAWMLQLKGWKVVKIKDSETTDSSWLFASEVSLSSEVLSSLFTLKQIFKITNDIMAVSRPGTVSAKNSISALASWPTFLFKR